MNGGLIAGLGAVAKLARRLGLGPAADGARETVDRLCIGAGWPPLRVRVDGSELRGFLRHRSFLAGVAARTYEAFFRELFEQSLRPGMTVIDGGAHIGLYTVIAARHVAPGGRVIAFEPSPYNARCLRYNISRNHLKNVQVIPKVLSERSGVRNLYVSAGTISNSVARREGLGPLRPITVSATSLDEELSGAAGQAILVKLDVEGAEPEALRGMALTLARASVAFVMCEVNPHALREAGSGPAALVHELRALGLTVDFIDEAERRLVPVLDPERLGKGNLFCRSEH